MNAPEKHIIITDDGSPSIQIEPTTMTYHSTFGAMQESKFIFLDRGLNAWINTHPSKPVRIFEMGLGTGLNAAITLEYAIVNKLSIEYTALELFPMDNALMNDYINTSYFSTDLKMYLREIHQSKWDEMTILFEHFHLRKHQQDLRLFDSSEMYDLIYFDAFAPDDQPELWTEAIFSKLYEVLSVGGILVTYCSKGTVRRTLQSVGFKVEKLAGPPGKREILRAGKR